MFLPLPGIVRVPPRVVILAAVIWMGGGCEGTGAFDPPGGILEIVAGGSHLPVGGEMTVAVRVPGSGTGGAGASSSTGAGSGSATPVNWSSSHPEVAAVSSDGRVRGESPGVARITARQGPAEAWLDLTVLDLTVSEAPALTRIVNLDPQGRKLTRFDVEGNALDVHGGEILHFEGLYYWYGEYYACGFQWQTAGTPFCGFRVWTSPDLLNWTDRGELFAVTEPWQVMCGGQGSGCFRPHVLRSPVTGRWVLWFNGYDAPGGFYIFEATSPLGPFHHRHDPSPAQGVPPQRGDHNLFADEDGTGYIVYTLWPKGDIVVEELTPDYLATTGNHVVLGVDFVEAPALFRRGDRYYMTLSDPACGYCETGTSYLTAPHPLGPWSDPRKLTTTSCGGQPGHVSTLPGSDGGTWYLYYSDLWNYREFNQATATQYISPLLFDDDGEIRPISCAGEAWAPVRVRSGSGTGDGSGTGEGTAAEGALGRLADGAARGRLLCDMGSPPAGGGGDARIMREFRFTAPGDHRLTRTALTLYQQGSRNSTWGGSPDSPLVVQVIPLGEGHASGSSGGGEWDEQAARQELPPETIPWSARVLRLEWDLPLREGGEYAIRLTSTPSMGCYGFAFQDVLANVGTIGSWTSRDGGATWSQEPEKQPFVRVETTP